MTTLFYPTIDKHVPMPTKPSARGMKIPLRPSRGLGRRVVYPFLAMEPTDSFFVPVGGRTSVTVSACRVTKANGWKFSVRNWVEEDMLGIRVWRTV